MENEKKSKILMVANEILNHLESSGLAPEDWATAAEIAARISKAPYGAIDWSNLQEESSEVSSRSRSTSGNGDA